MSKVKDVVKKAVSDEYIETGIGIVIQAKAVNAINTTGSRSTIQKVLSGAEVVLNFIKSVKRLFK